jgi:hypothetical protein
MIRWESHGDGARAEPETLLKNDTEAHHFVRKHRKLLNIPPRVPITIHPRFQTYKNRGSEAENYMGAKQELLLKVSWQQVEEDDFDAGFPKARSITCGTTFVMDWKSRKVETVQTPDMVAQKPERDRMVRTMLEAGLLRGPGDHGKADPVQTPIRAEVRKGVLRLSGAGRLLHFHR